MIKADAVVFYTRVGRVAFDDTEYALDFINAIEARTRIGFNDYQKIMNDELSIQAVAHDWFVQSIRPSMSTMTWLEFKK